MPWITPPNHLSGTLRASGMTEYVTRAEAAQILSVSLPTLDGMIERGIIPALKVGRVVRIARDDLSLEAMQARAEGQR